MSEQDIANVLAARYASPAMRAIWSAEGRILQERELWIAVMRAQRDLGLEIPEEDIAAYERVKGEINMESIQARERVTRHDVKARIEEFCDLAGCQQIHKGMTSRDLTENVEQLQVWRSMRLVCDKSVAALARMSKRAQEWRDVVFSARTHNVAAQASTVGKRVAMFGEEMVHWVHAWLSIMDRYRVRGIKGAVGTQLDQLSLFGRNERAVAELESRICSYLGIPAKWVNVGQVYPRSLDFEVVSGLVGLASAPSSFCITWRLMVGHELCTEGFAKGQTGSSAMPHKMNPRSCERINGFHNILKGLLTMAAGLAGNQWNEGDVSCSVVRRCLLPDAFFAMDGLLETFLTTLDQIQVYVPVVRTELNRYLPFLMTTTILMAAVKRGVGREEAHEVIKEHAVAVSDALRCGALSCNNLAERLADDPRLKLSREEVEAIFREHVGDTGMATSQVDEFCSMVHELVERFPSATSYNPGPIL